MIDAEYDPHVQQFYQDHIGLMNDEQRNAFQVLTTLIDRNAGGLFNIDAPGGTGKIFLCNVVLAYV